MIYFDNASTSFPKAPGVLDTVSRFIDRGCFNIGRGTYAGAFHVAELVFETRELIAELFGYPSSRNVIFTPGATHSLNLLLKGLLKPGDHVVTTMMEHNAVLRPLHQLAGQGITLDAAFCNAHGQLALEDLEAKIRPNTKLVIATHASNVCGTVLPIREIGQLCQKHEVLFLVDAAQTAGSFPLHMEQDHVDAVAFPAHKGLLALPGLGGLVVNDTVSKAMEPLISGGTGSFSHSVDVPELLPDRFEAGTLNLPGIAALHTSLHYLKEQGIEEMRKAESRLLAYFLQRAAEIPQIQLYGTTQLEQRCAIAAFDVLNMDNGEATQLLDERYGIMVRNGLHCAPWAHQALGSFPQGLVRCSFGAFNRYEEIDQMVQALHELARV